MSASVHRDLLGWLLKWYRKAVAVTARVNFSEVRDAEVSFSESRAAEVSFAQVRTAEVTFSEVP